MNGSRGPGGPGDREEMLIFVWLDCPLPISSKLASTATKDDY
jgi:hypothetical protein